MGCLKSKPVIEPEEAVKTDMEMDSATPTKPETECGKPSSRRNTKSLMRSLSVETHFSEGELREYLKTFKKKADKRQPKGRMNNKEIEETFQTIFKQGDAKEISEQILQMFDADGDGFIDFSEFVTVLSITRKGTSQDKMRLAFDMIDTDNNGTIEREEMIHLVRALHKLVGVTVVHVNAAEDDTPEKHVEKMMEKLDTDKDNVITFQEFCEGVEKDPAIAQLLTAQTNPDLLVKRMSLTDL